MGGEEFHPELRSIARILPRAPVSGRTLPIIRWMSRLQTRRRLRTTELAEGLELVEVAGPGTVTVRLHRPPLGQHGGEPLPALLWIHGGGYVMGTAAQDDGLCRNLADRTGAVVAAVDYRLAPEYRFPIPLEDCYQALSWLADQPDVDRSRVAIGGASAGGGLAAALALMAHERNEVPVAFQLLAYPMLDDRTTGPGTAAERRFRLWNSRANRFGWQAYTGMTPGGPGTPPLAAPARYPDLIGLPPAWIGVGTLDLFYEEDLAYAERLRAAGVECELHIVRGAFHGFDAIRPSASVSRRWRESQTTALRGAFGVSG